MSRPAQRVAGVNQPRSLSAYLGEVEAFMKAAMPSPCWITAEVANVKYQPNGHVYFDLVEMQDGREVAKCRGSLFKTVAPAVLQKWQRAVGGRPGEGMKLLISAKADFSAQYGFSLTISDIDPTFTVGEMQAKMNEILQALKDKGWSDLQKKHADPISFWRVAVIAPHESAGLADFQREAKILDEHGVCRFTYFSATFQGPTAGESIQKALREVHEKHQIVPYDVVCIIRGGGAKTDLAWLNDRNLAAWVCRFPAPVYVGIGHEIDKCVLDFIAKKSFDTPSKVIGGIRAALQDEALMARQKIEKVQNRIEQMVATHKTTLMKADGTFQAAATQILNRERQRLLVAGNNLHRMVLQACAKDRAKIEQSVSTFQLKLTTLLEKERTKLQFAGQLFEKTNPLVLLNRGFAMVKNADGVVMTSAAQLREAGKAELVFADGTVTAKILKGK